MFPRWPLTDEVIDHQNSLAATILRERLSGNENRVRSVEGVHSGNTDGIHPRSADMTAAVLATADYSIWRWTSVYRMGSGAHEAQKRISVAICFPQLST